MTFGELKAWISHQPDDMPCAYMIWRPDDVAHLAKEKGVTLLDTQVEQVLNNVQDKACASIGINWDVISFWIDQELEAEWIMNLIDTCKDRQVSMNID